MKRLLACGLFASLAVHAEQLRNPDPETLWTENGKDIKTNAQNGYNGSWLSDGGANPKHLEITPAPDGKGFVLFARDAGGRKTYTSVPVSKEYPYVVFRITSVEHLKGYRNWTLQFDNPSLVISQVTTPEPGIFVFDLFKNTEKKGDPKNANLFFYAYNLKLGISEIKLMKTPDYRVDVEAEKKILSPGDKLKFTVTMKEEAEDVSIRLFTAGAPESLKLNGLEKIQLKPVDKTQKIWSAEVTVKTLGLPGKDYKPNSILLKTMILGGTLEEPVWSNLPYGFESPKK